VSLVPLAVAGAGALAIVLSKRLPELAQRIVLPLAAGAIALALWHLWARSTEYDVTTGSTTTHIKVFPTPGDTLPAVVEMLRDGRLVRYSISSVYRVLTGFAIAAVIGIPLGLWIGWFTRASYAINPFIQGLRPISPLAWIPIAILGFGIKDAMAIFIIFLGAFFPIVTGTMTAVRTIPVAYVRSAQNFGLGGFELFRRVVLPASLPQIVTSLRLALGVGWLVVVAAEMNAINSGLGFLIIDARNMGLRYDLVVAGMLCIGLIGVVLDWLVRRLENFDEVRWGFSKS
jgi:NitT/TauT family transport system permease protein